MGEALLTRSDNGGSGVGALIKVTTFTGATVTCTCEENTFTAISTGEPVEFELGYGIWNIQSVLDNELVDEKPINVDTVKIYEVSLIGNRTYGISIDMSNSDPETAVTYTDDAVGITPLSVDLSTGICNYGGWKFIIESIIGCKPCMYKDGVRMKYLDPDDYTKYDDGTDVGSMSVDKGDVMIEFKKLWYKYAVNGTTLTFQIANYDRSKDGFVQAAFKSMDGSGTIKDYMYFGAYEGLQNGDGFTHSWSGFGEGCWEATSLNANYNSYTMIRDTCKAVGDLYGMEDWCKRYYIIGLCMLVAKTRGLQAKLGAGNTYDNGLGDTIATGTLDKNGLFSGYNSSEIKGVKCFGIENLWGNYYSWCDGIITTSSTTLGFKDCPPYNDTGEGYTNVTDGYTRNSEKYPTSYVSVMDGAAITASVGQADASLGFCDYVYVYSSSGLVAYVGGYYYIGSAFTGPFFAVVSSYPGNGNGDYVGRLVSA